MAALLFTSGIVVACSSKGPSAGFDPSSAGGHDAGADSPFGTGRPDNGPGSGNFKDDGGGTDSPHAPPAACAPDPANFDIPGNGCDDDANGKVDDAIVCDTSASASASDPLDFARALGLCNVLKSASDPGWGVVVAKYTNGYGAGAVAPNPDQVSTLAKFGDVIKPREGDRLAVLSTGYAQEYNRPVGSVLGDGTFRNNDIAMEQVPAAGLPSGFPQSAKGCPSGTTIHDVAGIHLEIKTPKNAQGIAFAFDFWSSEWPEYICSAYNDAFLAYLETSKGAGNVSLDKNGNGVSVNNNFFDRCTPNTETGCSGQTRGTSVCAGGESELAGTGFYSPGIYCGTKKSVAGGATGWLQSKAQVTPGEVVKLDFIIWDTGDYNLDSSVLLDELTWVPADAPPPPPGGDTGRPPPVR